MLNLTRGCGSANIGGLYVPILQIRLGVCFLNIPMPLSQVSIDLILVPSSLSLDLFPLIRFVFFSLRSIYLIHLCFVSFSTYVLSKKKNRKRRKKILIPCLTTSPVFMSSHY
ncbi:hypothetical protein BDW42DRAFT_68192 [Aspergillus taichungensis]|uniref:Uncharacterized protein n=1 Tax=Aspergillus taichungensis TaxID=482145 RepID=A0A2J5HZZ7_9EURO|nr:hypothetical protein BDW42DRAFT_68192 [Aspergillus taichungensis]